MQVRLRRPEAGGWTGASFREEKATLGPLGNHSAPSHGPLRRLFGDVDRERPRGDCIASQFHALGRPVRRSELGVARRGGALRISQVRRGGIQFVNIEGVGWMSPTRMVTVSD